MNKFLNNLERKYGKYAIPNLTLYIVILYAVGYVMQLTPASSVIISALTLNPVLIMKGQIWRLVSWLLILPPRDFSILIIITLFFYYFVGSSMERTIGTFRYNLFILSGIILMIIGAFLSYFIFNIAIGDPEIVAYYFQVLAIRFSTYYLQQIVFLAFAILYPEVQVLLMFIIPIKVKYLGYLYGAFLVYECFIGFVNHDYCLFFAIGSQFVNLLLFYASIGRLHRFKPNEMRRRNEFQKRNNARMAPKGVTRHKCAVCGRTEVTNPDLEFRFCSKCNGNYEYCQDHLFTHQHVQ